MDYVANMSNEKTRTNDITARWTAASSTGVGAWTRLWACTLNNSAIRPVFPAAAQVNYVEWDTTAASLAQFNPSVAGQCAANLATGFNPCAVYGYQSGGYGEMEDINAFPPGGTAQEHQHFSRAGLHELKYGFDGELVQYGDKIWYSGLDGARALVFTTGGDNTYYSLFRLPPGVQARS